jgi:CheY-like chemotaxis protein
MNILLVEDSEDDVFFFKRSLARAEANVTIHVAGDGAKAIEYLSKGKEVPDIIFLDLKMPNQNGFEVLEWLKKNPALASTKVFVLTSSSEPKERELAQQLGADAYFLKPLSTKQLREALS